MKKSILFQIILAIATVASPIIFNAQSVEVGTLPGSLSVSPTGAANYTIPIDLPAGRAGMTPELALVYNSQGGNGLLGIGWTIAGMSAITRTGTNLYNDGFIDGVDFDVNDQFALDGQRLIPIDATSSTVEYRTEQETYSKIIGYGFNNGNHDPSHFIVYTKDGRILEYGNTSDSRIEGYGDFGISWNLNRISDRKGNYIDYVYYENNKFGRLSEIKYTGNSNLAEIPFYIVKFHYSSDRSDKIKIYLSSNCIEINERIESIEISYNSEEIKTYQLNYDPQDYFFSRLLSISLTSNGHTINPNVFEWGGNDHSKLEEQFFDNNLNTNQYYIDYNGDGKSDLIQLNTIQEVIHGHLVTKTVGWNYRERLANGFSAMQSFTVGISNYLYKLVVGDFNSDGLFDFVRLVYTNSDREEIRIDLLMLSNGNGFDSFDLNTIDSKYFQFSTSVNPEVRVSDFYGDGKMEILIAQKSWDYTGTSNNSQILSYFSSFPYYHVDLETRIEFGNTGTENANVVIGDFNGDGKADILSTAEFGAPPGQQNTNSSFMYNIMSTGVEIFYSSGFPNNWHRIFPGDFNKDGITDILTYNYSSDNPYWTTNCFNGKNSWIEYQTLDIIPFDPYNSSHAYWHSIDINDYNGDGYSDILKLTYRDENQTVWADYKIYYSNGSNFLETSSGQVNCFNGLNLYYYSLTHQNTYCDFNGDGKSDIFTYYSNSDFIYLMDYINDFTFIKSITNGFDVKSEIAYKPLTDVGVYSKGSGSVYPLTDIQAPLYVVSKLTPDMDLGSGLETEYYYSGARIHKQGRGFLGFQQIRVTDKGGKIVTTTNYSLKTELISGKEYYYYPYPSLIEQKYLENGNTLMKTENDIGIKRTVTGNNFIYSPVATQSISWKWDENGAIISTSKSVQEIADIDNYGNSVASKQLVDPANINKTAPESSYKHKSTYTNSYTIDASYWLISRPGTKSVTQSLTGANDFHSMEYYTYYGTQDPDWPFVQEIISTPSAGHDLSVYTDFEYDDYGNVTKKTEKATRFKVDGISYPIDDRVTVYTYNDASGYDSRFLTSSSVTINNCGYQSLFTYDPLTGNVLTGTSADKLVTQYVYDDFGKLEQTINPDGTKAYQQFGWASGHPYAPEDNSAEFYHYAYTTGVSSSTHQLKSYIFYDKFEREVRNVIFDLDNNAIFTDSKYNNEGRIDKVSEPYSDGAQPSQWTSYKYDDFGRNKSTTLPNGNIINQVYSGRTSTTINTGTTLETSTTVNAIGQTETITDPAGTISYTYFSSGNVKNVTALGTTTSMTYDDAGQQTSLTDPDGGLTTYIYDPFEQLIRQTDAKGNTYNMKYDKLGRMVEKELNTSHEVTRYIFNDTPLGQGETGDGFGKLSQVIGGNGFEYRYFYDELNRLSSQVDILNEQDLGQVQYIANFTYDNDMGRLDTYTYPSGFAVNYDYTVNGMMNKVKNNGNGQVLWECTDVNQRRQITGFTLGNGLSTVKEYDAYGFPTRIKTGRVQNLDYVFNPVTGNLTSRSDSIYNRSESFTYDGQLKNRLASWQVAGQTMYSANYASNGNILKKSDVTQASNPGSLYQYTSTKPHAVSRVVLPASAYLAASAPVQDIDYTAFNKIREINHTLGNTKDRLDILYGPDNARKISYYYKINLANQSLPDRKKYFIQGNYEIETDNHGNQRKLHYISSGDGLFAIYVKNQNTDTMYYVQTDYLGSYYCVTDSHGEIVGIGNPRKLQVYSFDPWGRRRNYQDWTYNNVPTTFLFDRGYTGHEHLDKFGLINMNGRVYDPWLGSFLSPDPFVQAPSYSQNYNRYSYCLNNPLKYTDPDGEWIHLVIGAAIGGVLNVALNWNNIDSFGEGALYFGVGAAAGALAAGVGAGFGTLAAGSGSFGFGVSAGLSASGFGAGAAVGASSGFVGGFLTTTGNNLIEGNNFGSSLKSGLIAGGYGAAIGGITGGLSGGIRAVRQGNNFWTGNSKQSFTDYYRSRISITPLKLDFNVSEMKSEINYLDPSRTEGGFINSKRVYSFMVERANKTSVEVATLELKHGYSESEYFVLPWENNLPNKAYIESNLKFVSGYTKSDINAIYHTHLDQYSLLPSQSDKVISDFYHFPIFTIGPNGDSFFYFNNVTAPFDLSIFF